MQLCACIRHPKSFPQSHLSNNFSYSLIARFTLDKFESLTAGRHRLLPGKAILVGRALQIAPTIGNPDAPLSTQKLAGDLGYNALISVPLIRDGKVVGALNTVVPVRLAGRVGRGSFRSAYMIRPCTPLLRRRLNREGAELSFEPAARRV